MPNPAGGPSSPQQLTRNHSNAFFYVKTTLKIRDSTSINYSSEQQNMVNKFNKFLQKLYVLPAVLSTINSVKFSNKINFKFASIISSNPVKSVQTSSPLTRRVYEDHLHKGER